MKLLPAGWMIGLLISWIAAGAAEPTPYVSETFREILTRVSERSPGGAISHVRAKNDSPLAGSWLSFSLTRDEGNSPDEVVVVTLERNLKAGGGVCELYRLKMDDALRVELALQTTLAAEAKERQEKFLESQKKRVQELSAGRLSYGMTLAQVEAILGAPLKSEPYSGAEATINSPTWTYPDMQLMFYHGQLQTVITPAGNSESEAYRALERDRVKTKPPEGR